MEMYMASKMHYRFRQTLIRTSGVNRIMNLMIDTANVLIKVGLGIGLMWMITSL
jgi:hypothetical protein